MVRVVFSTSNLSPALNFSCAFHTFPHCCWYPNSNSSDAVVYLTLDANDKEMHNTKVIIGSSSVSLPSMECLKRNTARYAGRNSWLKREYFCYVWDNFLEKKPMGRDSLSILKCRNGVTR